LIEKIIDRALFSNKNILNVVSKIYIAEMYGQIASEQCALDNAVLRWWLIS